MRAKGASEIIYVAKLGTLVKPSDIYNTIYCPTKYCVINNYHFKSMVLDVANDFVQHYPTLDSGWHCSVPTVMEELYPLREDLEKLGASTIDNEISQIAHTVQSFNRKYHKQISFSPIHYATDYLRKETENNLVVPYDLTMRSEHISSLKSCLLENICAKIHW
jgi:hypothetical protein